MAHFQLLITEWYRQNKRSLPWRTTKDAYSIWLSEIILQQTRVEQGLSYYNRFVEKYPSVVHLANADEQEILNLWQGLGYYSRARNLHATAKVVVNELNAVFPSSFKELLKLKGIGNYTAAAIASFSSNECVAVVDGNVYRVLSRVFDISLPIDSTEGKKTFAELAQSLIDPIEADTYNQAIMEFGALQCTPVNPNCENCPLIDQCLAFQNKTIKERPVKQKKTKVRNRYFNFLVLENPDYFFIQQRVEKDIWQNMFQFPLIEKQEATELDDFSYYTDTSPIYISEEIIHILSHQRIHAKFFHFDANASFHSDKLLKIKKSDLLDYPIPRLIDRYLENKVKS